MKNGPAASYRMWQAILNKQIWRFYEKMGYYFLKADRNEAYMKGIFKRLVRIFFTYSIKIISLLLAVSMISFILISASPVDPVRQYILGIGTAISPEQRAEIEDYWGSMNLRQNDIVHGCLNCCMVILENLRFIADQLRILLANGL